MHTGGAPDRIDELESIRGIAALLVVLFHLPQWWPAVHAIPIIRHGGYMVDLFFVLSGFVISRAYGARISSPRDMLRFQLLRLGRLYPVHLLFLFAFLGIEIAKWLAIRHGVLTPEANAFESNSGEALLAQVFLVQSFTSDAHLASFNGPAWSISVEFWCYALFALLAMLLPPRVKVWVFATIALVATARVFATDDSTEVIARCLAGFFTGTLVAVSATHARWIATSTVQWISALILIVYVAFPVIGFAGIYPLTAMLMLVIVRGEPGSLRRFLQRPAMTRLGAWSYSIYMSHFLVIYCTAQAVERLTSYPRANIEGTMFVQLPPWLAVILYAGIVAATLLISALVFARIEKPLRAWSRVRVFQGLGRFPDPGKG